MSVFAGPEIISDSLVLHLDAGNKRSYPGSGNTWIDLSNNGNNGNLVNNITYSSNNMGMLSSNSTISNYVTISHANTLNPGNSSFTFGAFVRTTANVASDFFPTHLNKSDGDWRNGYLIRANWPYDGKYIVGVSQGQNTGVDRLTITSNSSVSLNTWVNIVGVWDAPNKTLKLYFNGIENGSNIITNSITVNPTANLELFRYNRISKSRYEYLDGVISSVQIYNRALSANEVKQNFNALRGRYGI